MLPSLPVLHDAWARQAQDADPLLTRLFPRRRIDKVLLVNPPDADAGMFRYDTAKRRRYTNYPPYGLAVLARHLREIGVDVRIVNLNHEILKACVESASEGEFDFDGVWQEKVRGVPSA